MTKVDLQNNTEKKEKQELLLETPKRTCMLIFALLNLAAAGFAFYTKLSCFAEPYTKIKNINWWVFSIILAAGSLFFAVSAFILMTTVKRGLKLATLKEEMKALSGGNGRVLFEELRKYTKKVNRAEKNQTLAGIVAFVSGFLGLCAHCVNLAVADILYFSIEMSKAEIDREVSDFRMTADLIGKILFVVSMIAFVFMAQNIMKNRRVSSVFAGIVAGCSIMSAAHFVYVFVGNIMAQNSPLDLIMGGMCIVVAAMECMAILTNRKKKVLEELHSTDYIEL